MLFSSCFFLFVFLPTVLILHAIAPTITLKNLILLVGSLFFYAWGEGVYLSVMVISIMVNYFMGILIDRPKNLTYACHFLCIGIIANLLLLCSFKYLDLILDGANYLTHGIGLPALPLLSIHLPIGISFFTFQGISYLVDVYRRDIHAEKNLLTLATYKASFPQLVAGPIVRYPSVAHRLHFRLTSINSLSTGAARFIYGLSKKVLIANNLAIVADDVFAVDAHLLPAASAWMGLLCYSLQIYFDFSGYSDMAIGLARMFGFRFPENFQYPYTSRSIREFWRRWHISLSTWFRDYLYKPLGGSRLSDVRTYMNLITVFFLCGLWHGASWNFALWGLFHGGFLCLERTRFRSFIGSLPIFLQHAYAIIVVMAAWVFFRCTSLSEAKVFFLALSGYFEGNERYNLSHYASSDTMFWIIVGILAATPLGNYLSKMSTKILNSRPRIGEMAGVVASGTIMASLFILSVSFLVAGSYNPFIYFRF